MGRRCSPRAGNDAARLARDVLEEAGQTIRSIPRTYLDDLLTGWQVVTLDDLQIAHARTGGIELAGPAGAGVSGSRR
jgi:hypothetical protein